MEGTARTWKDSARDLQPTSLYVHIPFCGSRCFYCDFTTYVAPPAVRDTYVDALCKEFELLAGDTQLPLQTVFFGGGTPTLLSPTQWQRVFHALRAAFRLDPGAEITVEANPGTIDSAKLEALAAGGVNRISFGAQTMNDRLLMAIGRLHDREAVFDSVQAVQSVGISNINLDLMFGLPDQSLQDVEESLSAVLSMAVPHVSAYWLKVEAGTPFAAWQEKGALSLPGEDVEADMYEVVRSRLQQMGYVHYEVSNFARLGKEAEHNLVYWRNQPYLAAGVGAHAYVRGERTENVRNLPEYTAMTGAGKRPLANTQAVSIAESMEDTMMLGLRLREGVSHAAFLDRHGVSMENVFGEVMRPLLGQGLLVDDGGAVRVSDHAWPIANAVFERFIGVLTVLQ